MQPHINGYFYDRIVDKNKIPCRSLLTITTDQLENIKSFDALFVMMNPGGSKPKEKNNNTIKEGEALKYKLTDLVDTEPDDTQYQIMKLMEKISYKNVAIINLSDIRNSKSKIFIKEINELSHKELKLEHSIFDDTRTDELQYILSLCVDKPIIFASGVYNKLQPLTNHALNFFNKDLVFGWKKNVEDKDINCFFHPLPRSEKDKEQWINELFKQLRS